MVGQYEQRRTWSKERKRHGNQGIAERGDTDQGRLTEDSEIQRILAAMFSKSFGSLLRFALGKLYLFVSQK